MTVEIHETSLVARKEDVDNTGKGIFHRISYHNVVGLKYTEASKELLISYSDLSNSGEISNLEIGNVELVNFQALIARMK